MVAVLSTGYLEIWRFVDTVKGVVNVVVKRGLLGWHRISFKKKCQVIRKRALGIVRRKADFWF